jgi:hypothetical protein
MSLSCSALLRLTCGYDLFVLDRRTTVNVFFDVDVAHKSPRTP